MQTERSISGMMEILNKAEKYREYKKTHLFRARRALTPC